MGDFLRILLSIIIPPVGVFFESRTGIAFLAEHSFDTTRLCTRFGTCSVDHCSE